MSQAGIIKLLGTGSSSGIPIIGCECAVCSSMLSHNKRLRTSALISAGDLKVVVDVGPDFRTQCLLNRISHVDGVIITHSHYDHIGDLDDLRIFNFRQGRPLPCLMSEATLSALSCRLPYIFNRNHKQTSYSSALDPVVLSTERGNHNFLGLPIRFFSYAQGDMPVTGFRFGDIAYVTDIKTYPETLFEDLAGVRTLILSALKAEESPLHFSLQDAVNFAHKLKAKQTYLIHMTHDVDHIATNRALPADVQLAYDGQEIDFLIPNALTTTGPHD